MTASDFIHSLPQKASPEALDGVDTSFYFDLDGEGGGQYTVQAEGGELKVLDGKVGEPKCTVKTEADRFMKLIRGEGNPMMAVMTGKVKISNTGELLKYAKLFGIKLG